MRISIISEYGYKEALLGLGLSYGLTEHCSVNDIDGELLERLEKVAITLAGRGGGEDKFLRQITVYLDLDLPLYMWSQFDTYKVGTVAQSESKMHTLKRKELTKNDFNFYITDEDLSRYNSLSPLSKGSLIRLDFLQRRIVSCNYAVLDTIIKQRKKHKLYEWREFCECIYNHIKYPELLEKAWKGTKEA